MISIFLALLMLSSWPAWSENQKEGKPPAAVSTPETEIIFNGKLFCSLKRRVDLLFKGVITTVAVHSGQWVEQGEVLASYRLAPETVMQIRQRLSPAPITDMEMKLAEIQRNLVPLQNKQRELTQLTQKNLAPSQSLSQVERDIQLLTKEQQLMQERLRESRQTLQQDRGILGEQLNTPVKSGQVSRDATLVAPISGYIVAVNPEMRQGAELMPTPAVFQIGVMNPMLVRAQAFETEALQIKVGDIAEVTLESLPGKKFEGTVSRVAWSINTPGLEQPSYYEIELKVPNPDLILKEGLKARIVLQKSSQEGKG